MNEKILVVDDEETLRLTLRTRLRSEGFTVQVAADGEEALEKLKNEAFDLVLLDIKMPRMDGIEALGHIVQMHPDAEVVMLTGFADFTTAIECLKKGAKDYLVKPIDSTELISRLRAIFRARASEKAYKELQVQYMSTFLHDLLGPVSTIDSTIDHLEEGKSGSVTSDQQFLLRYAGELSGKVTQRIKDMIDLSQFEAGTVRLQCAPIDLATLTGTICVRFDILARAKGLTFQKSIENNLPHVNCDFDKIAQVLNNILDNAIKFTLQGGKVSVSVARAPNPGGSPDSEAILFTIQDTGVGIPTDEIPLVFNKYKEVLTNKPTEMKKMVLGLTISRHIVEAHGGRIWAESEVGAGSKFYFALSVK